MRVVSITLVFASACICCCLLEPATSSAGRCGGSRCREGGSAASGTGLARRCCREERCRQKITSFFASDGIMIGSGQATAAGRAELTQAVMALVTGPDFQDEWEWARVELSPDGKLAYLVGNTTITINDTDKGPVTSHARLLNVWRKDPDGIWRCVVDMWVDEPAPTRRRKTSDAFFLSRSWECMKPDKRPHGPDIRSICVCQQSSRSRATMGRASIQAPIGRNCHNTRDLSPSTLPAIVQQSCQVRKSCKCCA